MVVYIFICLILMIVGIFLLIIDHLNDILVCRVLGLVSIIITMLLTVVGSLVLPSLNT